MRRRADDDADGHGGGGAGGSDVVRRSSCSRPDITGRNPVPECAGETVQPPRSRCGAVAKWKNAKRSK